MKRKFLISFFMIVCAFCLAVGFSACNGCSNQGDDGNDDGSSHTHTAQDFVIENEVAATCTEDGSCDAVVYCSVCGEEMGRETITIAATGHTWDGGEVTAEAACTEAGTMSYTCTVCGETKTEEIAALGHDYVCEETIEPTYTATGLYTYTCSRCGDSYTKEIAVLGHTHEYESRVTKGAACTEDGVLTYTCSLCDDSYTEVIPATGHTQSAAVVERESSATCTENGSYAIVVYCSVCGEEISRETITVSATGHTAGETQTQNYVAATCTASGSYESVVYCSICGEEISRKTIRILASGHTLEYVDAQAATCTEIGWNAYEYCTVCDYTTYEEVSATGHSLVHVEAQTATCTEIGWNAYEYCTVCGYTTYEEIPATGHTDAEAVTESYTAATCTEAGSYDSVVYCSLCTIELSRETIEISANGHTLVQIEAQAPTCTEIGWNAYEYCTVCDYTTYEEIPATGHTESEAVTENYTAATCTEAGSYDSVVYCSLCNTELSRETIEIPATGHTTITKIENAVASTCTQEGLYDRVVYCSVCEVEISRTTKTIDKKEHFEGSPVTENEVAATCTVDGSYDTVIYCKTCAAELSRVTTAVSATGHTWNSGVVTTAATATSSGVMTYTCINCGETRTEIIPAKGTDDSVYTRVDADGNEDADGDYIYFGSYPQTEVTDSAITAELTSLAGELPTSTDSCNWTSYGYYIGTDRVSTQSNSTDYMWYIDITYSGVTYRGVYFTSYRPYGTYYSSSESNSYQDDNGYYINSLYWFEYEPILWRILEEETSGGETYATILCEMLIDSQAYQNCYVYSGGYYYAADDSGTILTDSSGNKVYANNYAYSTIREWLNDTFYNTAFNQLEQALIQLVTVDNSAGTTSSSTNLYACGDTEDYVWLLSYQDVVNASYGFNSSASTYDKARQKKTTDYAKSQGAFTSTSTNINSRGNGDWWVRSPYSENSNYAGYVYCHGYTGNVIVNVTYRSVCPALKIKLS